MKNNLHRVIRDREHGWLVSLSLVWLTLALSGTFLFLAYANTPGGGARPPATWPEKSQLHLDNTSPVLLMFLHPQCPCSQTSVEELSHVVAQCQTKVVVHLLFFAPTEMGMNWTRGSLWEEASKIPGAILHRDINGDEAKRFRVNTSGQAVLYNAKGKLLFSGGLTIARGHSGDNPGCDAVTAIILGSTSKLKSTPVFGCELF